MSSFLLYMVDFPMVVFGCFFVCHLFVFRSPLSPQIEKKKKTLNRKHVFPVRIFRIIYSLVLLFITHVTFF